MDCSVDCAWGGQDLIHYEVKVASFKRQGGGAIRQLGNIKAGEPAPEFAARDLEDREVTSAELRGRKVALLDFWATWCGPCPIAMPSVVSFKRTRLEQPPMSQNLPVGAMILSPSRPGSYAPLVTFCSVFFCKG
jgi:hypothetical protein